MPLTPEHPSEAHEKLSAFQLLVFVLSILALGALIIATATPVPPMVATILQYFDTAVCALLFIDFCIRFKCAPKKLAFMKWGWIDLIACIPNLDVLRFGRMVRILRIIRLLRGVRAGQRLWALLLQNKPKSAVASVILTTILMVTCSSIGILIAEDTPIANIKTADDALWWSVTTITTVGYGDKYPITMEGRVIAMILMFSGVGLFGILSGSVASFFLGQTHRQTPVEGKLLAELQEIKERLEQLKLNPPQTSSPVAATTETLPHFETQSRFRP
jgi:voltage-gated potassium channel